MAAPVHESAARDGLERVKPRVCLRCGLEYTEEFNVGSLRCGVHPPDAVLVRREPGDTWPRYSCCGLTPHSLVAVAHGPNAFLDWFGAPPGQPQAYRGGCTLIDHDVTAVATGAHRPASAVRAWYASILSTVRPEALVTSPPAAVTRALTVPGTPPLFADVVARAAFWTLAVWDSAFFMHAARTTSPRDMPVWLVLALHSLGMSVMEWPPARLRDYDQWLPRTHGLAGQPMLGWTVPRALVALDPIECGLIVAVWRQAPRPAVGVPEWAEDAWRLVHAPSPHAPSMVLL